MPPELASSAPEGAVNIDQAASQIDGLNLFGLPDNAGNPKSKKDDATLSDDTHDQEDDDIIDDPDSDLKGSKDGLEDDDQTPDIDDDTSTTDKGKIDPDTPEGHETPEVKTLSALAEALEVDTNYFDNLELTFKADGQDITVTLSELRAGYQKDANYRRQTSQLAETRQQYETVETQRQQQYEAQVVQLGQVLQQGEQILVGNLNTAEMQTLRVQNPSEWTARRQEIQQRIDGVKQLYSYASQQYETFQQNQANERLGALQTLRQKELETLQAAIPDWGDDFRANLLGYLNDSYQYSENDLAQVFDSRLIMIANKARLYDEMKAVGKKTKTKIHALPKVQKPSKGGRTKAGSQRANIHSARKRLAKTGKVRDAADLIGHAIKEI